MPYLLNLIYLALVVLGSPWLAYRALVQGKYRAGWGAKFWGAVPVRAGERPCIWLHAVSVGEVNLLRPLVRELAAQRPDCELVVTSTTRAGYELAKTRFPNCLVSYAPLDFSWAVRRALRRWRPAMLVLAELEVWPNLLCAARDQGVATAIVNGRLSARSHGGYRRLRPFFARVLAGVDLVAVQNEEYAERFRDLGARPESVVVTGSIKFDGAETCRDNPATENLRALAGWPRSAPVFLAGSTQAPEESLALAVWQELVRDHPELKLIVVPRHPERFGEVARSLAASGAPWARRTELGRGDEQTAPPVLLVDAVGELGGWWGLADVAFVGGSLGKRGGQNMIEPAAYGAAVSFGPNTQNFRDIVAALLAAEGAHVVADGGELTAFVRRSLEDQAFAARLGGRAQALVISQQGATARTLTHLLRLLPQDQAAARQAA